MYVIRVLLVDIAPNHIHSHHLLYNSLAWQLHTGQLKRGVLLSSYLTAAERSILERPRDGARQTDIPACGARSRR
eukprot:5883253-Pyramimonas_sp.AAC.1